MFRRSIVFRFTAGAGALALAALLFTVSSPTSINAATAPTLGAAGSYAVIAGSTVTNTGPTTIEGDLGVWPGTDVTGFPPGIVTNGSIHAADAHAGLAQDAVTTAYNDLETQPCDFDLTDQDLGGQTLIPGVYCFDTSAQLTGLLTLNAQGSADAVFVFQTGSTLTTASASVVDVINGGNDCNVFWQVGSSATLGTGTVFVGNILALTSITLTTGASISGRALARNGAVTLDTNDIGFDACTLATATASPAPTAAPTPIPTPTPIGETPAPTPVPTPTPIGQTPTPIPTPTPVGQTPSPTLTPTPVGQTPTPTPTATPIGPTPSPTPVTPTPSSTPVTPTPTNSPSPTATTVPSVTPTPVGPTPTPNLPELPPPGPTTTPRLPGFPNTGGPPADGGAPSVLWLLGLVLIAFGTSALVVSRMRRDEAR